MAEGKAANKMIEGWQIKKIHALKGAMKMPDDYYRKLIYSNYHPHTSSKDLTLDQANHFIENLETMAVQAGAWNPYEGKSRFEELGARPGMATPAQLRLIEGIWKEVSNVRGEKKRKKALRAWIFKQFKVSDLRFIDNSVARKVIHVLKIMQQKRNEETHKIASDAFFHDRPYQG